MTTTAAPTTGADTPVIGAGVTRVDGPLKVTGADGSGTGSGWVYDDVGHIITNNHVVAGAADGGKITVVLANGQQVPATVVGRDGSYDLAVVKVDLSGGQQITASVTKEAVSELGLSAGSPVTVVVKSTDVLLGVED